MADLLLEDAERVARSRIRQMNEIDRGDFVLLVHSTIELDIGWVFFWDSQAHQQTRLIEDAVAGGGPIFVDRRDGTDHMVWSGEDWTTAIERYRRDGHLDPTWLIDPKGDRHEYLQSPEQWPSGFFSLKVTGSADERRALAQVAQRLDDELELEVGRGHRLRGRRGVAIAKRDASDHVLFALPGTQEVVVVHLTWSGKRERAPWPSTVFFSTFNAFMTEAHKHWHAPDE